MDLIIAYMDREIAAAEADGERMDCFILGRQQMREGAMKVIGGKYRGVDVIGTGRDSYVEARRALIIR